VFSGANLTENAAKITELSPDINRHFLMYSLRSPAGQHEIASKVVGTSQPKLALFRIKELQVPKPNIPTQKKIVSILSAYDDLIENNTRHIKILEKMAQRIYREWFVHSRFPGHEKVKMVESELGMIPEGWNVKQLKDFGEIITGKTPSKKKPEYYGDDIPFIKTPDMHGNMFCISTGEYLSELGASSQKNKTLPPNTLCVSCIGTVGVVSITSTPSQTNQQINSIITKEELLREFLYFLLLGLKDTIGLHGATGATMFNLSKGKFESMNVIYPMEVHISHYHKITKPMFDKIKALQYKNSNLRKTRDMLLPKLISGKIDVEDLNIEISDEVLEISNKFLANSQLIEETKGKQTGSILKKTDDNRPSKEKVDTSEALRVPTIEEFDINEMMAAFRQACRSRGIMDREELLKEVSIILGYKRLGDKIKEVLRGHLRAAIRRKIIGTSGSDVCIETPTMDTYKQEELIDTLCSVMRKDREYERDDVIREVANHLGFKKLRDTVITPIKSAINGSIRRGILGYEGSKIWRES